MKILTENWEGIVAVIVGLWTALQTFAPITKTKLDDKVVAEIKKRLRDG